MVKPHAFQNGIRHFQIIMVEFMSEVICKVPFSVLCGLFSLCLLLLSAS